MKRSGFYIVLVPTDCMVGDGIARDERLNSLRSTREERSDMGDTTRYTGIAFRSAVVIGIALTMMYSALFVPAIPTAAQDNAPMVYYGYTYQQPDGNRYVIGQGTLPESVPLDVELNSMPLWVVAARQSADASAGDFDGDGQVELLVPSLDMSELSAIQRVTGDAIEAWSVLAGAYRQILAQLRWLGMDRGRCGTRR